MTSEEGPARLLRADVAALPRYRPGRSGAGSARLSANESPEPPHADVVAAAARAAGSHGHRYPDFAAGELTAQLADRHGTSVDHIAVGCGSVALCQQLVHATCAPGDEVLFAWRSFEAYPIVAGIGHARPVRVPLLPDGRHDLPRMADRVGPATRLVFLCSPNNPTGPGIESAELSAFFEAIGPDVVVALDEAYYEYVDDAAVVDGASLVHREPRLVALRTFSKAFGLAAFRVGYAVGHPELVDGIRAVGVSFAVSGPAQAAASTALRRSGEVLAVAARVCAERRRVERSLHAIGLAVPAAQGNFVWLPLGMAAASFAAHAGRNGVSVRTFDGEGVRVTIGARHDNDRFLQLVADFTGAGAARPSGREARW